MMKRLCICLMALLCLCTVACAEYKNPVVDGACLLREEQRETLQDMAEDIWIAYDFAVVVHTVDGTGGQPIHLYAADFYDENGYGYGKQCDGLILVVDMEQREYVTVTTGSGIPYFSDRTIACIEDDIVDSLSEGEYYQAFMWYLASVENQLQFIKCYADLFIGTVPAYGYYDDYVNMTTNSYGM